MKEKLETATLEEIEVDLEVDADAFAEGVILEQDPKNKISIWNFDELNIMGDEQQKAKLFASFALYQGEVQNPEKTDFNPFFKSKYAPLSEVLNATRPIMSKYGLSTTQFSSIVDGQIGVTTMLMHSDGGYIIFPRLYHKVEEKDDLQKIGAKITYARRYSISSVLNVSSEPDDDGEAAKTSEPAKPKKKTEFDELVAACKDKAAKNREAVDKLVTEYSGSTSLKDVPKDKIVELTKKVKEIK